MVWFFMWIFIVFLVNWKGRDIWNEWDFLKLIYKCVFSILRNFIGFLLKDDLVDDM